MDLVHALPRSVAVILMCAMICLCCNSCLALPKFPGPRGKSPEYAPRPVQTVEEDQLRAIEKAVRHLAGQLHDVDQIEALADVQRALESGSFLMEDGLASPPEVRRWVVWLVDDELRRRVGTWSLEDLQSGRVSALNTKLPRLLNAASITTPEDWVEVFLMPSDPGPDAQPARYDVYADGVNGLESDGPQLHFSDVRFAGHKLRKVMQSGDGYDRTIRYLYAANPVAAATTLLEAVRTEATADARATSYTIIIADAKLSEARAKVPAADRGQWSPLRAESKPGPYTAEMRTVLLELAERPDWPVRLYILEQMKLYEELRDPEVLDLMLSHGDPVTERFVANFKTSVEQRRQAAANVLLSR